MLGNKRKVDIHMITTEIVDEAKRLLKEEVYKILLYGSYARGDFNCESDIDIIIILNCSKGKVSGYRKEISRVASRVGLKNDIEISLLLRDRDTFENGQREIPFYKNIQKEGIALYG